MGTETKVGIWKTSWNSRVQDFLEELSFTELHCGSAGAMGGTPRLRKQTPSETKRAATPERSGAFRRSRRPRGVERVGRKGLRRRTMFKSGQTAGR